LKLLILFSILPSIIFAACPYIDCSLVNESEKQSVISNIDSNEGDINKAFESYKESIENEANLSTETLLILNEYFLHLKENRVLLYEIDLNMKKKVNLLNNLRKEIIE